MKTKQVISEIGKLPMLPEMREEITKLVSSGEVAENLNGMSDIERSVTFNFMRLSCYEGYIEKLGYLPSELIARAAAACSVSIRTISQLDENSRRDPFSLFYAIRGIGEGIASADKLDKIKHNKSDIRTYSTHDYLQGLSSEASAGDCFLFNVMIFAADRTPFKDISVPDVVKYYFNTFSRYAEAENKKANSVSILSMALNSAVEDIFKKSDPQIPKMSEVIRLASGGSREKTAGGRILRGLKKMILGGGN